MANETEGKVEYPVHRDLDGIYFRVYRNGRWVEACFTDLTEEERDKILDTYDLAAMRRLCVQISETLRWFGDELNLKNYEV